MDCFAFARNDAKRYAQGKSVILRGVNPEESPEKRSFTFVQDDIALYSGISITRHCDERSEEAIQERDTSGFALNCRIQGHTAHTSPVPFVSMTEKRQKAAFTLAEVLITLGIIGVIAAMTLPMLIADYQKKVVETKLKVFYATINNAFRMSQAEHGGVYSDWILSSHDYTFTEMREWLDEYLFPYMKHFNVSDCMGENNLGHVIYKQEGICFHMANGGLVWMNIDHNGGDLIYFANGKIETNTRNHFQFQLSKTDKNNEFIEPYIHYWNEDNASLKTHGTWGCYKGCTNCAYCTKLIQLNGWEIPDDYPW